MQKNYRRIFYAKYKSVTWRCISNGVAQFELFEPEGMVTTQYSFKSKLKGKRAYFWKHMN